MSVKIPIELLHGTFMCQKRILNCCTEKVQSYTT